MKDFAKFQKHRKIGHYSKSFVSLCFKFQEKFICEYFPRHFEQLHLFILNIVSTTRYEVRSKPVSDSYPAFFLPIATTSNKNF